jgi:poly-gamma-glutamate synthesis protein (capsule biosynthesis protein)
MVALVRRAAALALLVPPCFAVSSCSAPEGLSSAPETIKPPAAAALRRDERAGGTAGASSGHDSPRAALTFAAAVRSAPAPVRVLIGGDVLPHRPRLHEPAAIASALAPIAPLFAQADVAIVNYEAATGDPGRFAKKSINLAASPAWFAELARLPIHAVTVANNHACDLGAPGLTATLSAARDHGVLALGADEDDPWAPRVIAESGGARVCAVAWTTFVNKGEEDCAKRRLAVADLDRAGRARIAAAVRRAKSQCDAVIAIAHGGEEYRLQVAGPKLQARAAAEAGADAVLFHHPHVPSPVDVYGTKDGRRVPFFASLGNLVSNQGEQWKPTLPARDRDPRNVGKNGWTRLGVVADLQFAFDGSARLVWGYHLVWTENTYADRGDRERAGDGEGGNDAAPRIATRLLDPVADEPILASLARDAKGARALFASPCWLGAGGKRCR